MNPLLVSTQSPATAGTPGVQPAVEETAAFGAVFHRAITDAEDDSSPHAAEGRELAEGGPAESGELPEQAVVERETLADDATGDGFGAIWSAELHRDTAIAKAPTSGATPNAEEEANDPASLVTPEAQAEDALGLAAFGWGSARQPAAAAGGPAPPPEYVAPASSVADPQGNSRRDVPGAAPEVSANAQPAVVQTAPEQGVSDVPAPPRAPHADEARPAVARFGPEIKAAADRAELAGLESAIVLEKGAGRAPAEEMGLNVWADRLRERTQPTQSQVEAEAPEPEAAQLAPAATQMSGEAGADGAGSEAGSERSTPTMTVSKPQNSAEEFQVALRTVDTSSSPAQDKPLALEARPGATRVAVAVEDIVRGRAQMTEANATARVEVELDGQRISVRVQIQDGRVDVEIGGMDASEISKLERELSERLQGHDLNLGDLTQDTGNGRDGREQVEGEASARGSAEAESPDTPRVDAALLHDGAVYVTA